MKGHIRKTLTGWVPADEQAQAIHRRQKVGQVSRADVAVPRNYKHHCLFMVLLNEVTFPNQERYVSKQEFRRAVALAAGHCEEMMTLDGEILKVPLPYDYDHCPDEGEFTEKFGAAMTICAAILRHTAPELEEEVARHANEQYGVDCPRIFRETIMERTSRAA
jgi:hypothetical protein